MWTGGTVLPVLPSPGSLPSPVVRSHNLVVTIGSYQVSLSNSDYWILEAAVTLETLIQRHVPTTSLSSLSCCEIYNRIVSWKGEGERG